MKERIKEIFNDHWETHRGRIVGLTGGLVLGVLILLIGFFKTLFLLILMFCGYLLGEKIDNKESIIEILDRFLPSGYNK